MKQKLLSFIILLFIFSAANSQSLPGLHLGVKVGASANKLSGGSFPQSFTYGYQAGVFAEIKLHKKWWLHPEVLFNQVNTDTANNFNKIYNGLLSTNFSRIRLSYLSIPVLFDYKACKFFSFEIGAQASILMNQNEKLLQDGQDAFKKGDASLVGGIQIKLRKIRVQGRYCLGLFNLNNVKSNGSNLKSQSIQVGLCYGFL